MNIFNKVMTLFSAASLNITVAGNEGKKDREKEREIEIERDE